MKTTLKMMAVMATALGLAATPALAEYPENPIKIIVPAGAGGDTDFNARMMSKYLEAELGQPLPVVNMPGAAGTIGAREVLNSKPDGYTVLFYHGAMQVSEASGMSEFGWKDFELAALAGQETGSLLVVPADAKWQSLDELIEDARANPGTIDLTANIGATTYLIAKLLEAEGAEFNLVDVGGAADRLKAVLGGNVAVSQNPYAQVRDYLAAGELRALAALTDERIAAAGDIPTAKELGYDVAFQFNYFFLFPKDTPAEIVEKFGSAVKTVAQNPEYAAEIDEKYAQTAGAMTGDEAKARLGELDEVIAGVKLD